MVSTGVFPVYLDPRCFNGLGRGHGEVYKLGIGRPDNQTLGAANKRRSEMKIQLLKKPFRGWKPDGDTEVELTASLPFFKSKFGAYTHRVRSGRMYFRRNEYSHTAIHLWCGSNGYVGDKGKLLACPASDAIMCATCEGRAIGAGQTDSRILAGRILKYSPKI